MDLSENWLIRLDPDNIGLTDGWEHAPSDTKQWRTISVPDTQPFNSKNDGSIVWYRRTIHLPENWASTHARLRFESVATAATVWINGKHIGQHIGDYLPFGFDITPHLQPDQQAEIIVRVEKIPDHITKGFHDVLSIQHGGIWQPVSLIGSGPLHIPPNGVAIRADAQSGKVQVEIEVMSTAKEKQERRDESCVVVRVFESWNEGSAVSLTQSPLPHGHGSLNIVETTIDVPKVKRWSPDNPTLYTLLIEIYDKNGSLSDTHTEHFGFRSIDITDQHLLLNGSPIHLRGILHWGHEPHHIAPAPPPDRVRTEFEQLRAMGFNGVCLCMWYPPRYFFEIADETGMLIWQEHPVWQSPMEDEHLPEYRRLYKGFMRRDRNRPSVIIVSATCEHPNFHPELADWWWETAHREMPGKALQVQTSSFAWSNPEQTDLYDEHTYDNNDRWSFWLADLQDELRAMPKPKPFIVGESVVWTSWPDTNAILEAVGEDRPWWLPPRFDHIIQIEQEWTKRNGTEVVERFKQQADRYHLLGRKFQIERFRSYPNHAGLVMNHLRDVPACTCGFKDDLDRWRFEPEQTQPWLSDCPLILDNTDFQRSFASEEITFCGVRLSNFSRQTIDGSVQLCVNRIKENGSIGESIIEIESSLTITAPGEIGYTLPIPLNMPTTNDIQPLRITASSGDLIPNAWDIWIFPKDTKTTHLGIYRMTGLPFTPEEKEPDKEERGYSRGFGIEAKSWRSRLPNPAELLPELPAWPTEKPIPNDASVIVTHRLTSPLIDFMTNGGRVILLASKAEGGLGTRYEWLFGGNPLVIEEEPLSAGDSDWIVDLLSFDLTKEYCRVIPIEDLKLIKHIDPLIRFAYTHDQEQVRFFDFLFMTNVGAGLLLVSSLDHHAPAGQYLLEQMIQFAHQPNSTATTNLSADRLRSFTIKKTG